MNYPARVAAKANELRPARIVLSVLSFPFYVLGLLLGLIVVLFGWVVAAVAVGIADVKAHGQAAAELEDPDAG